MTVSLQLCGLLLYALASTVSSQSGERVWHTTTTTTTTTTPAPTVTTTSSPAVVTSTTTPIPSTTTTTTPTPAPLDVVDDVTQEGEAPLDLPQESVDDAETPGESPEQVDSQVSDLAQDVLNEKTEEVAPIEAVEFKKEKKPRKWISIPSEESSSNSSSSESVSSEESSSGDSSLESDEQQLSGSSEEVSKEETVDGLTEVKPDDALPADLAALLEAAEEGPMVQETIVSKKTTIYVTITESLGDSEPIYVNLTGIRDFTGQERRIVSGCLDLSDLYITGEEAREIIQRMSKHKFHRLDLSNNNIRDFPTNTFGPVAFTVRELRLDGNPLLSNARGEGSMLQRGGLFHLTELRELNLSRCGLEDIDFFTPWNSNNLELLDLSSNALHSVPSNLQFFHKLKKLYLDGNAITRITELPFALLWNMQTLSLSDCLISSITSDPFRNMERLKEISLQGNNLTRISDVRLPRSSSNVKMYLSGNPWHCACDILTFIEHYHYAIRDIEDIRCASPRWLEGLRTAYLTKEILSLDSVDGGCASSSRLTEVTAPVTRHVTRVRGDRLEVLALAVFVLAALFMVIHVLCARKKDKYKFDDDRDDINYIRIDKKPSFK